MYVGVVMISKTPRLEGWREKAREARNEDGDLIRSWRVGQAGLRSEEFKKGGKDGAMDITGVKDSINVDQSV
jgi:hypothetical protein